MAMNKDNYVTITERRLVEVEVVLDSSLIDNADEGATYILVVNGKKVRTMNYYTFCRLIGTHPWK